MTSSNTSDVDGVFGDGIAVGCDFGYVLAGSTDTQEWATQCQHDRSWSVPGPCVSKYPNVI